MPKGGRLTGSEIEFIRQNCLTLSDEDIANKLDRTIETISRNRKKLGIHKGSRGGIKTVGVSPDGLALPVKMDDQQRKEFFKTKLVNSFFYSNIQRQFSEEEIEFYIEEWTALCLQFQDIVTTETRQIDELIKASIMDNRILRNIKIVEDEIELLTKEVDELRDHPTFDGDIEMQQRDDTLLAMVNNMSGQSKSMAVDHHKLVDLKNKLLGELNARRRDRIEQIQKGGTNFLSLIEAFQNEKVREIQGRHAELVKLAKDVKKASWHQEHMFPDGSKDNILLDEHSVFDGDGNAQEDN